jgi:hypothetical protein
MSCVLPKLHVEIDIGFDTDEVGADEDVWVAEDEGQER